MESQELQVVIIHEERRLESLRHEIPKFPRGVRIMLESGLQEAIREVRFYPTGHPSDHWPGPRECKEISRAETLE